MAEDRYLDDWIDAYMQYTENSEPPKSYKKWSAISAIATCLQRKCMLMWEGTLYPNMYIVLVGPSGARKGTAMRQSGGLIREIGMPLSPEAVTREQLIRRLKKSGTDRRGDFYAPDGRPIVQSSLTIFSEELTVFLGYNNIQLMADLCNWYDCPDPWSYETKNMGQENITNVWVNLFGATTPRLLQTTLPQDAIGGGLASRIIFVYEQRKGKTVTRPFKTPDEIELEQKLLHDLESIYMINGEFAPTQEFIEKWDVWYSAQDETPPFNDPRLEGYITRRGTHVLKLSMILNASRKDGNLTLTGYDFDRAVHEITKVERNMGQVFLGIGKSEVADVTADVMRTIAMRKAIKFDELLSIHMHNADYNTMRAILATVTHMETDGKKWCKYDLATGLITYTGA